MSGRFASEVVEKINLISLGEQGRFLNQPFIIAWRIAARMTSSANGCGKVNGQSPFGDVRVRR